MFEKALCGSFKEGTEKSIDLKDCSAAVVNIIISPLNEGTHELSPDRNSRQGPALPARTLEMKVGHTKGPCAIQNRAVASTRANMGFVKPISEQITFL